MTADRNKCTIDYEADKNRFLVRCPVWFNDMVRTLPSVRWQKGPRAWAAPLIGQNVAKIKELSMMGGVQITEAVIDALRDYDKQTVKRKSGGKGFPSWYPFKREPLKHQRAALDKHYHQSAAALFMDMQTGKSKTAIDLTTAHRMEGHTDGALVVTKLSLRRNWIKHFEKDCPVPFDIFLPDSDKPKVFDRWLSEDHDYKVMVIGWESLSAGRMADMAKLFLRSRLSKGTVIGDETTYITNHKAGRTKHTIDFGRLAAYRYALAGEPWLEGPMNLFAQFEFLDPEIIGIGDFLAFRNRYAIMGGYMREVAPGKKVATEIVGYQNMDELTKILSPFITDVRKKDAYPNMPPKLPELRTVELTKAQQDLLIQIKREDAFKLKGSDIDVVMQNVLETALRRHQITGGYAVRPRETLRTKRDGTVAPKIVYDAVELVPPAKNPKMLQVVEAVEEFRGKKQMLLWAVYMPEIEGLLWHLKRMGLKVGELHGRVPERERQPVVDGFERGELDIICGNASTGGMGYTMMTAEVNMFYNNTFKAIDRVQAEDRCWGQGQMNPVAVIDFAAEHTIDNTILRALEDKQDLSQFLRERIQDVGRLLEGEL